METEKIAAIYYFVDKDGSIPVKEYIEDLTVEEQAKVFAFIGELKKQGNNMRRPMADYLEDGIYELRPKNDRIFYFFYRRNNIVLVHAIKKHVDKIPRVDLALCLKRKRGVESDIFRVERC